MAKVRKNIILQGVSGKFAGQIVFRHLRDGRTILAGVPDFSKRVLSDAQKAHHAKVKAASAYAKVASKTHPIYAQLAEGTTKNAYNMAMRDFFHAPVIDEVDLSGYNGLAGNPIIVRAHDDFKVTRLLVTVSDLSGEEIESGEAVETPPNGGRWVYTAISSLVQGSTVRIAVIVNDQPGGEGEAMTEKTL